MKNLFLLFSAIIAISISSCKENKNEKEPEVVTVDNTDQETKTYEIAKGAAEFNDPFVEEVFNQYLQVQEALVNTDFRQVVNESSILLTIIKKGQTDVDTLNTVSAMVSAKDIELQRMLFVPLTKEMDSMLVGALKSGKLYKQYCPMAFNNSGAYWISSSKDILNPYFGDKMLKCGRVEAEIK